MNAIDDGKKVCRNINKILLPKIIMHSCGAINFYLYKIDPILILFLCYVWLANYKNHTLMPPPRMVVACMAWPQPGDTIMLHPWTKFGLSRASPVPPPGFVGNEPLLADVLRDPIIHSLMACDGIDMTALKALIGDAQRRLQ